MDLIKLTETIIKNMVSDPETVSVKEFETDEENTIQIEIIVSSSDIGSIIGKEGKMIGSIRNIVQAASFNHDNKRVKLNIDSY